MMSDTFIKIDLPSALDFVSLRNETEWGAITEIQAKQALSQSLCGVIAHDGQSIIGMARVLGDGALCLFIQDMIIARDYRGQGYGQKMMITLISHLQTHYDQDCTVGLMAAKGKSAFYTRFGFNTRPDGNTDAGMTAPLSALDSRLAKTITTH